MLIFLSQMGELVGLDSGLCYQYVCIKSVNGKETNIGQVIGVYDENKFMWNPRVYTTLSIFTCTDERADPNEIR